MVSLFSPPPAKNGAPVGGDSGPCVIVRITSSFVSRQVASSRAPPPKQVENHSCNALF
jgi:hypothetical protein